MRGHRGPVLAAGVRGPLLAFALGTLATFAGLVAYLLALTVPVLWWKLRRAPQVPASAEKAGNVLLAMLAVQIGLGIATLLLVVPLPLFE